MARLRRWGLFLFGDPALTLRLRSGQARWANVWHASGVEEKKRDGSVTSERAQWCCAPTKARGRAETRLYKSEVEVPRLRRWGLFLFGDQFLFGSEGVHGIDFGGTHRRDVAGNDRGGGQGDSYRSVRQRVDGLDAEQERGDQPHQAERR